MINTFVHCEITFSKQLKQKPPIHSDTFCLQNALAPTTLERHVTSGQINIFFQSLHYTINNKIQSYQCEKNIITIIGLLLSITVINWCCCHCCCYYCSSGLLGTLNESGIHLILIIPSVAQQKSSHKPLSDMHWTPEILWTLSAGAVCVNANVWVRASGFSADFLHLAHKSAETP